MATPAGFEPATVSLEGYCSTSPGEEATCGANYGTTRCFVAKYLFLLPCGRTPLRQITVAKCYNCTILVCFEPRAPGSRPTGQGEAGRLPGPPRSPAVLKITPNWDELTPASAGLFFFNLARVP